MTPTMEGNRAVTARTHTVDRDAGTTWRSMASATARRVAGLAIAGLMGLAILITGGRADARAQSHLALVIDGAGASQVGIRSQQVADALSAVNYQVTVAGARDVRSIQQALAQFRAASASADVAIVYFNGTAVSIGGRNRLLVGPASNLTDVTAVSIALDDVMAAMAAQRGNVILLDASVRNGQLASAVNAGQSDVRLALGELTRRPGFLVATATVPGQLPTPGTEGAFSEALIAELMRGDTGWLELADRIRWDTFRRTQGAEVPYVLSSLDSQVRLLPPGAAAPAGPGGLSPDSRRVLVSRLQEALIARRCHSGPANGEAGDAASGIAELRRAYRSTPQLDPETAGPGDFDAWSRWLNGTSDAFCPAPRPTVAAPVVPRFERPDPPERAEPPRRRARPRPARSDPPPRRREPSAPARRAPSGGGGGGGGGVRVPAF